MEKDTEKSEIVEKKDKKTDYSGYSEKQIDLDVDKRTGQVQQMKRAQRITQKAVVMSRSSRSGFVLIQKTGSFSSKKKVVTVFHKSAAKKV